MHPTNKNKRIAVMEELKMSAFQLVGLVLAALFFGALVTGDRNMLRR